MQENVNSKGHIGGDGKVREIYSRLSPEIRKMAAAPDNWWRTRKRYGKLTENVIRSYISSRLRDIRLKGRAEADKVIEKMIFDKKRDIPSDFLEFIEKNRAVWGQFLYDTASRYDADALVGFFVPLIYGGILSRKNPMGEMLGAVRFESESGNTSLNEQIFRASGAIGEYKRRGITAIVVEGEANAIYSERLLSIYLSSPNEVFIIIEREVDSLGVEKRTFSPGDAAYKRGVLNALSRSKNVFVVLDANDDEARIRGKSGALSSYGILHGFRSGSAMKKEEGYLLRSATIKKGSALAIFDGSLSLADSFGDFKLSRMSAENIIALAPKALIDFLTSPSFPVYLGDLYELLCVLQFVISCGNLREILITTV